MKTGLFFGTFNPIHIGHLIIAQYFINQSDLKKICFIVSPHNPLKNQKSLIDANHRLEMVKLAISGNDNFEVSDIEFHLPQPSYTALTLMKLRSDNPSGKFVIIMGSDSLESIKKWKDYKYLLNNFPVYIYPRNSHKLKKINIPHLQIKIFDAPLIDISATQIRQNIIDGKSINYLTFPKIADYLSKYHFFI